MQGATTTKQIANPGTLLEYEGLLRQRDELKSQRAELKKRMNDAQERYLAGGRTSTELAGSIRAMDARTNVIDAQLLQLDEVIGKNAGRVWGVTGAPQAPPPPPGDLYAGVPGGPTTDQIANAVSDAVAESMSIGVVILLSAVALWRGFRRFVWKRKPAVDAGSERMTELQRSIDVIALEVERISENQRFISKVLNEKLQLGAGEAQPVSARAKDAVSQR